MSKLNNILKVKLNKWVAALSTIGTLLGIIIVLFSVDFYVDYTSVKRSAKDALSKEFIIITKKINELHTTGLISTEFSDKEIEKIKSKPYFEKVVGFKKNQYQAFIQSKPGTFPLKFSSLVTFESIPDEFIDVKTKDNWKWTTSSPFLPVIVPRSYINMYNFGMADMQGLPVISEGMISNFTVELKVSGNGKTAIYDAKIVGFSDRIESVLVPQSFVTYSNNKFSLKTNTKPSKLIAITKNSSNPEILSFLDDNGYFTNKEKLSNSNSSQILNLTVLAIIFLGLLVMLLSLIGFIQQTQIKISKSKDVIYKLSLIGTPFKQIRNYFIKKLSLQFCLIGVLAYFATILIRYFLVFPLVKNLSLNLDLSFNFTTLLIFVTLLLLSTIYITVTIHKSIGKIAS